MSDVLSIALTSRDGITLNTKGTYCDKNIQIIPQIEDKTVTPTTEPQPITAGKNYAGLGTVTVGAIPDEYVVPSGEASITSNGTHDVSGKASAIVNVPIPDGYIQPSGTLEITTNGTYDVTNYESVDIGVEGSSTTPQEITTETEMTSLLEVAEIGAIYKYAEDAEDSAIYKKGALYIVEEGE